MDQDKENLTVSTEGFAHRCNVVFDRATADYHITDSIDADVPAPFPAGSIEALLYAKNWIDERGWRSGIWKTSYATLRSTRPRV